VGLLFSKERKLREPVVVAFRVQGKTCEIANRQMPYQEQLSLKLCRTLV
jgi:hypothetical protein